MKKIILIKNNKGGIGKTFVAINLADYLSKIKVNGNESKVLILTDDSQNNILMYSKNDYQENELATLETCIVTGVRNPQNIVVTNIKNNIDFIPFSINGISQNAIRNLKEWLEIMKEKYDFIIVDSNPSLQSPELVRESDYWIAPTELTTVSINSLNNTIEYVGLNKLFAIVPNKKRITLNHKEGEEYLKTQYLEELKELGKDDVIVTDSIKLSTEFESLLFDSKTVTELIEKSNANHSELNYIFFNLSEKLIEKMGKENNLDYKMDKNYILRNKDLIMKKENMQHLSEFQEKYDLKDITYNSKILRNKEETVE